MSVKNEQSAAKEQKDLVGTFRKLLTSRKYAKAELIFPKLNGLLKHLEERAPYCSVGYDYMQQLCSGGKLGEARNLAKRFDYLGFDVFYAHFTGELENNRKLNKSTER